MFLLRLDVLAILLIILGLISLFIGVIHIPVAQLLKLSKDEIDVLILARIPRTVSIIITGMSLSICGLVMQQLTQNKFVSPTTAGTMDCAKFGILISIIFFAGSSFLTQVFIASFFALLGSLIFLQILNKIRVKDVIFVPLIGLMFGGIISSVSTFLPIN